VPVILNEWFENLELEMVLGFLIGLRVTRDFSYQKVGEGVPSAWRISIGIVAG
jgi:hypothetical protein